MSVRYLLYRPAVYVNSSYHSGDWTSWFSPYWLHNFSSDAPLLPVNSSGGVLGDILYNSGGSNGSWGFSIKNSSAIPPTTPDVYQKDIYENGYGMLINNQFGRNIYDSVTDSWSQLGSILIDSNKNFTFDSTIFDELAVTFWFVDIPPTTAKLLTPSYSISTNTVSFVRNGFNAYALILGR